MLLDELQKLVRETRAQAVFFNRDPDPFGRRIEDELTASLAGNWGLEIVGCKDVSIHERDEVLTSSGEPFRVFTPYARAWTKLAKARANGRVRKLKSTGSDFLPALPTLETWGLKPEADVLEAGEKAARTRMKSFLESGLAELRDGSKRSGRAVTSRLSQDLRFGLMSIRELFEKCQERESELPASGGKSVAEIRQRTDLA